jgi:replicative DNA helicase
MTEPETPQSSSDILFDKSTSEILYDIATIIVHQNENIVALSDAVQKLADNIESIPTKKETRSISLRIAIATLISVFLMLIPLGVIALANRSTFATIQSCVTSNGKCSKRNATTSGNYICQIEKNVYSMVRDVPNVHPLSDPNCP